MPSTTELTKRVRAGLVTYAAGDALGVPWEGLPAAAIADEDIDRIPRRGDWPSGATSDDTALTLLTAAYLADVGAVVDERAFLDRLAAELDGIRGVGPSTRAAVRRYVDTGAVHAGAGSTNGAPMRALPAGWAVPAADDDRRRELTVGLSRTTHGDPGTIGAACVVSALGTHGLDGAPVDRLIDLALDEITWCASALATDPDRFELPLRAADGTWSPDPDGVSLDAVTTVAALIHVLRHFERRGLTTADALRYAVSLGGDTDTLAAITGGVLGCRRSEVDLPWLPALILPDAGQLDALSAALAALRESA